MKRIVITIGVLTCLGAITILSLPFILSSDLVRGRISSHLTSLTGSEIRFTGDPSVSLSPFLGIELSDLTVKDPHSQDDQAALLRVESIKAKLDLLPALFGNIEISEYQLIRPKLNLAKRSESKSSWNFNSGTLSEALKAERNSVEENNQENSVLAKLGSFNIVDGALTYKDEHSGSSHEIAGVNGLIDWKSSQDDMSLTLDAVWQNETVNFTVEIDDPLKLFAGSESEIFADFKSVPLSLEITGKANTLSDLFVEGDVEAETPSINRLTEFLNTGIGNLNVNGPWQVTGKLNATSETTLLSDAALQIGDKAATGVIRIANTSAKRPKIDGTLAFDQVELTDYLAKAETDSDPIETVAPDNLDLDLRISANSIDTGRFVLQNVAAAITSGEGGWKFDIGNAEAFGGSLVAQVASETLETGPQLSIKFNTKASDPAELETLIGDYDWSIDGNISVMGDLRTQLKSATLSDLRFNGELEVVSENGAITGINFAKVFEEIQVGKLVVVSQETADSETQYEKLDLKVFLSNNIASISKASLQTSDTQIQFLGNADLSKGTLAIRAQRLGEEGPIPGRLIVGGTLNDPLVTIRSIPEPTDVHPKAPEQETGIEETNG